MTRWLPLYLRSRRLPVALPAALAGIAVMWGGWSFFTDRREVPVSLTVLTVALALAPLIPTLSSDDDSLEATAARPWLPRRMTHLIAGCVVVAALVAATRTTGAWFGPTGVVLRDAAGLTGLIGLGVALGGVRLAWQVPVSWTAMQMLIGESGSTGWRQVVFWETQLPGNRVAAVTAGLFLLSGVLAYGLRVGPRIAPAEATMVQ
ncbi:hypothetical protein [Actinoplanes sp. N902-109]|uniref:hypothetical protein n=1 Tax=Actinoplanes sp. (strain N902-109) TaxID=649831 RepID=UPI0005A06800|nr:hypothetical protein [Actinoplanes sp. N902-109]